jgi:glycosyltransferase involved in cell wall biosynthesis
VLLAHFSGFLIQFRAPLLKEMVRRGYATRVLVPRVTPELERAIGDLGGTVQQVGLQRTGLNPLNDLHYAQQVRSALAEHQPHLVIAQGIKPITYGLPAARAQGVPIRAALFAGLGSAVRPHGLKQRAVSWAAAPLLSRAVGSMTHIATQNADDAEFLRARFARQLRARVFTTPGSGVDLSYYAFQEPAATPRPMVLMTARLVIDKGVREFCHAAALIRARAPHVRMVLAGFFETRAGALSRAELESLCAAGNVEYVGHVADVRPLMRECRVLALPSYHEGRPRSVQEALATGRPAVVTDVPGCRDCFQDGVHGMVVPARDPRALANALLQVLDWPALPTAHACRALAEERYCAHRIAQDFLNELHL